MLRNRFNDFLKESLKKGEKVKTSTVRLIMAALKQRDIDARPSGNAQGISDEQIIQMLQTMIKQRRESIGFYEKGNRPELVAKEQEEIKIIESFLPQQMTETEIKEAVQKVIQQTGASSSKDMGTIMSILKKDYGGCMDFSKASFIIKQILT